MNDATGHWPRWITAAVAVVAAVVAIVAVVAAAPVVAAVAVTVAVVAAAALVVQTRHYDVRKSKNTNLPETKDDADKAGWKSSNDGGPKADLHQSSSKNKSNVKYVSPDGHKEVIYDSDGVQVFDARDIGTYNFCPSDNGPWYDDANRGHFVEDILPWAIFGNDDDDPGPLINLFS